MNAQEVGEEPDLTAWFMVLCYRWINEVEGTRCGLAEGHDGPCRAIIERTTHDQ